MKAEDLYLSQHHLNLMKGVRLAREQGQTVQVWIVSPMYGLISGEQFIAPYRLGFAGMDRQLKKHKICVLGIEKTYRKILSQRFSLGLVVCNETHLTTLATHTIHQDEVGGPLTYICSGERGKKVEGHARFIVLTNEDSKKRGHALKNMKGVVASDLIKEHLA